MKIKKQPLAIIITTTLVVLLSFRGAIPDPDPPPPPPPSPGISPYEQHPPIAKHIRVQKLATPLEDGSNVIMRIEYDEHGLPDGDTIAIYYGGDFYFVTFRDNGVFPDLVQGDHIYSAYLQENIPLFLSKLADAKTSLSAKGFTVRFTGHSGELVTDIPFFDDLAFNNLQETELDILAIAPPDCDEELLKQNSLFITDISVIEDGARTYNPQTSGSGVGTPMGAWTFGYMMQQMANTAQSGVSAKDLLKSWLVNYMDTITVNQQVVLGRHDIYAVLLHPWLRRCNPSLPAIDQNNWEASWNSVPEADILKYAPFRLTAIVNRIDLMGNASYGSSIDNAGETRFIFTLIPQTGTAPGEVPIHRNSNFNNLDQIDWKGMNIIFEYGNPHKKLCDIQAFAQQWLNLSDLTLGSPAYNDALEVLTRTVTDAGANPAKPNGSALNRIRTNERILELVPKSITGWRKSDWEFRQFELSGAGLFVQTPLTNTPLDKSNFASNLTVNGQNYPTFSFGEYYDANEGAKLKEFLFSSLVRRILTRSGKHNLPATYPDGTPLLAASARISGEYGHYFGINFAASSPSFNHNTYETDTAFFRESNLLRHQLSLNTCQGCHSGETKTMFVHMQALPYGQQVNYWDEIQQGGNVPFSDQALKDTIDKRFALNFWGDNDVNGSVAANYPPPPDGKAYQYVSPMITGRRLDDQVGGAGAVTYNDDLIDLSDDPNDVNMKGLYYVFDPSNKIEPLFYLTPTDYKSGFNDLKMRKDFLCHLVNRACSPIAIDVHELAVSSPMIIDITRSASHYPFPVGAH